MTPRGIRNNNPFNIRIGASAWQGKIPIKQNTDTVFEQFIDMEHGIRAGISLLRTYIKARKLDTIRAIITRFAPSNENDTKRYIDVVAKRTGIKADERITFDKTYILKIAEAICFHENGGSYISNEQIHRAWEML